MPHQKAVIFYSIDHLNNFNFFWMSNKTQTDNDKKNNAFIAFSNNNKFMYGKKV